MDNWILTKFNSRWIYISVKVYWNDSKSSNYMWLLQILVYAWSHWWLWPLREFTVLARKYTFSPATWICGNTYIPVLHTKFDLFPYRKLPIRGFDSQMHKVRIIRTKPLKSNICLSQLKENIRERPRYFAVNKIGVRLRFCARRPHKPPHCSCTLSSYKKTW